MRAAVRSRTADDDALVTEMYRQYRMPLMSYVLRLTVSDGTRSALTELAIDAVSVDPTTSTVVAVPTSRTG